MPDALGSMYGEIDSYKLGQLEAAATGGSAGVAAYKQGQAALDQERQASVARAASRAALIGGPEAQGFEKLAEDQYGRGSANLASSQASFEANMARRLAANQDYLTKAAASIPAYRAQTDRMVGLKQAAAKAKAADDISLETLLGLAVQGKEMAKPLATPGPVDFGAPQQPGESIEQYLARLNTAAQGRRDAQPQIDAATKVMKTSTTDLAAQIGRGRGVSDDKIAGLYAPGKMSATQNAEENLSPEKDSVAKAIATKYDTRGVDYPTAQKALSSPDFKAAEADLMEKAKQGKFTRAEVDQHLRNQFLTTNPALYWILAGEYLLLFPEEVE